jgi:GT2 family glycosyltransferase
MINKIGIIVTTFLRDPLMYKIVQSIIDNWKSEYILFIGNQSYQTDEEKIKADNDFRMKVTNINHVDMRYYMLPYDCGLSYARNYLVQKAHETGCNYIFLTADSYEFKDYKLDTLIEFLESDINNGVVGFVELNKPTPEWQWDVKLIPNDCFLLTKPKRPVIDFKGLKLQPCDIVQNFFLAKTQVILDCQWDNELKLTEHEDFFYRLQNETKYKVFFNDSIKCFYVKDKPASYSEKRQRIYNIYKKKLQEKYHIKGWIRCQR